MVGLDELETAVMGIVVQDQKQLAKLSTAMLTDSHENLRQSLIGEVVRKQGDCVYEGERPSPGVRRRQQHQHQHQYQMRGEPG